MLGQLANKSRESTTTPTFLIQNQNFQSKLLKKTSSQLFFEVIVLSVANQSKQKTLPLLFHLNTFAYATYKDQNGTNVSVCPFVNLKKNTGRQWLNTKKKLIMSLNKKEPIFFLLLLLMSKNNSKNKNNKRNNLKLRTLWVFIWVIWMNLPR